MPFSVTGKLFHAEDHGATVRLVIEIPKPMKEVERSVVDVIDGEASKPRKFKEQTEDLAILEAVGFLASVSLSEPPQPKAADAA